MELQRAARALAKHFSPDQISALEDQLLKDIEKLKKNHDDLLGLEVTIKLSGRATLGSQLTALRNAAGFTVKQAATQLHWSHSKLTRIETSVVSVSKTDTLALLDLYGVNDQETRKRLGELAGSTWRKRHNRSS